MKLNLVTIFCLLLGSIFAKNINTDIKAPIAQDRIKSDTITNLHGLSRANKVNLFGYECKGIVKSNIIRWKWAWSSEWRCPSLTSIVGYSYNYNSKKGALEYALKDFMSKFIQAYAVN